MLWFVLAVLVLISWGLTAGLRRYAHSRWLDMPNERSSHVEPTPHGGGLAVVVTFFLGLVALFFLGELPLSVLVGFLGAGALVAAVGFWDDHTQLPARWRLLAHFAASTWGVFWLGGLPALTLLGFYIDFGLVGDLLLVILLVWLLNLYNFMDGIDGIAGMEALTVTIAGAWLALIAVPDASVYLPLALAASVLGFLVWNYPPAKIFMGDVGSAFIGLVLGLLMVTSSQQDERLFWAWLILLGTFIVDATVTLVTRVLHGEVFYEAHRSHAYQYLSRKLRQHKPVTLLYGAVNLVWLFPVALMVTLGYLDGLVGLMLAYAPLAILALYFKAGNARRQEV
ncbi:glycosyltransferase family 4 protein [Marinimicrobium sp. ABcell2]|uniref:MraY family glycosyltransferase n=1 Tax=Marinimicrobium sp. ABcell2 TaxID=3069751 RepID=UPI0027B42653|nr:glycosyltransferase family 4 protein [Marinimicrobium sp. ABcell2]MDQ2078347.1 glycosyltransferase family 4 protein [Marinimicrobium sp. ABcell2]